MIQEHGVDLLIMCCYPGSVGGPFKYKTLKRSCAVSLFAQTGLVDGAVVLYYSFDILYLQIYTHKT